MAGRESRVRRRGDGSRGSTVRPEFPFDQGEIVKLTQIGVNKSDDLSALSICMSAYISTTFTIYQVIYCNKQATSEHVNAKMVLLTVGTSKNLYP